VSTLQKNDWVRQKLLKRMFSTRFEYADQAAAQQNMAGAAI
jgi:hypothetical protein